jgi:uncharacterized MAPEG superfamily protein
MTPDLLALTLAALLQVVQFALMAVPANFELGTRKTLSPRDADQMGAPMEQQLSRRTARLARAFNNHFEALILFAIAVVVTELSGQNSTFTAICAFTYLGARILYVPAYAFGWVPGRSYIWMVGLLATVLILLSNLF